MIGRYQHGDIAANIVSKGEGFLGPSGCKVSSNTPSDRTEGILRERLPGEAPVEGNKLYSSLCGMDMTVGELAA